MNELTSDEKNILSRVVEKPDLEGYFFNKIKTLKWFDPIKQKGFLEPKKIPKPIEKEPDHYSIPHWPVLNYLIESSKKLTDYKDGSYAEKYLQLARDYTAYCQEHGISNYHVWWSMSEVLQNIPIDLITLDDVSLFGFWLEDKFDSELTYEELVKVLLNWFDNFDGQHAVKCLKLIEVLFTLEKEPNKKGANAEQGLVLKSQSYRLAENIKAIAEKSGSLLGEPVAEYFIEQLSSVIKVCGGDECSYFWMPAIEDHEQNRFDRDTEYHFILAVRESLLSVEKASKGSLTKLLIKLAKGEVNILKRIALYITNECFDTYKDDVFNEFLKAESLKINLKHEMWELVKRRYVKFSKKQRDTFRALVDDLKRYKEPDEPGEPDLYHQAEWLFAIKENDEGASKRYQEIVDEIDCEPEHPGFSSYMSSGSVGRESASPRLLASLKAMDDMSELVAFLNDQHITHSFLNPGIEGSIGCVRTYVLTEEEEGKQLFKKLNDLQGLKVHFLSEIVDAYDLIWREPDKCGGFPWEEAWPFLIDFFEVLVNSKTFWNLDDKNEDIFVKNRSCLLSSINRLLQSGCNNDKDSRSFGIDSADKVRELVSVLLDKQPPKEFDLESCAITQAINSPKGQALETLICLALFESRHADKQTGGHDDIWVKYVNLFESEMKKDNNTEFYTLVPYYLDNIEYLSKDWLTNNFEFFFNSKDEVKWVCALQGFSYNRNDLHSKLYNILKEENVFEGVLKRELTGRVDKSYIELGLTPFLTDKERLEDSESLVTRILARKNSDELQRVIWFVCTQAKYDRKKETKIYALFPKIIDGIDYSEVKGKKLASNLVHWLAFIDELNDKTSDWVSKIAPYAEVAYHNDKLIVAFARWSAKQPKEVADIWLQVLKKGAGYGYLLPEKAFKTVYTNLIKAEMERATKDIASGYVQYNIDRPRKWLEEVTKELKGAK